MKPSDTLDVCKMYDETADSYEDMMDQEIQLRIYADVLGRLHESVVEMPGTLVDTACCSGHMLSMFRERFDESRPLVGVDLSSCMVAIAADRLGPSQRIVVGDMRNLNMLESGSAAAVVSFFAVHHIDPEDVVVAAVEWYRVLGSGGKLVVTAWEGTGAIDYGEESEIIALRYISSELASCFEKAGLSVQRCVVEAVEEFPMDAIYLECCKDQV